MVEQGPTAAAACCRAGAGAPAPHISNPNTPPSLPAPPQRKIREDAEISNAVAGGIAGERAGHAWWRRSLRGAQTGRYAALPPWNPSSARTDSPGPPPAPLQRAGAITATVVCPLDVLKTRLQVQGKAGAAMYKGVGGELLLQPHPPPAAAPAAAACQLGSASGAARAAAAQRYSYEAVAKGERPADLHLARRRCPLLSPLGPHPAAE